MTLEKRAKKTQLPFLSGDAGIMLGDCFEEPVFLRIKGRAVPSLKLSLHTRRATRKNVF